MVVWWVMLDGVLRFSSCGNPVVRLKWPCVLPCVETLLFDDSDRSFCCFLFRLVSCFCYLLLAWLLACFFFSCRPLFWWWNVYLVFRWGRAVVIIGRSSYYTTFSRVCIYLQYISAKKKTMEKVYQVGSTLSTFSSLALMCLGSYQSGGNAPPASSCSMAGDMKTWFIVPQSPLGSKSLHHFISFSGCAYLAGAFCEGSLVLSFPKQLCTKLIFFFARAFPMAYLVLL